MPITFGNEINRIYFAKESLDEITKALPIAGHSRALPKLFPRISGCNTGAEAGEGAGG